MKNIRIILYMSYVAACLCACSPDVGNESVSPSYELRMEKAQDLLRQSLSSESLEKAKLYMNQYLLLLNEDPVLLNQKDGDLIRLYANLYAYWLFEYEGSPDAEKYLSKSIRYLIIVEGKNSDFSPSEAELILRKHISLIAEKHRPNWLKDDSHWSLKGTSIGIPQP